MLQRTEIISSVIIECEKYHYWSSWMPTSDFLYFVSFLLFSNFWGERGVLDQHGLWQPQKGNTHAGQLKWLCHEIFVFVAVKNLATQTYCTGQNGDLLFTKYVKQLIKEVTERKIFICLIFKNRSLWKLIFYVSMYSKGM